MPGRCRGGPESPRDPSASRRNRRSGRGPRPPKPPTRTVDGHHPEAGRFHARHFEAADSHIGPGVDMLSQHDFVVHLVDVVPGQHHDVPRPVVLDDVHVLVNGIGGAGIPHVLGDPLARGEDIETLVSLGAQEVPASLQVSDQAVRLILRRHRYAANARVEGIGKRKVYDARLAAEVDGRLGASVCQFEQPCPASSRQDIGHRLARQGRRSTIVSHAFPPQTAPLVRGRISKRCHADSYFKYNVANGGKYRSA